MRIVGAIGANRTAPGRSTDIKAWFGLLDSIDDGEEAEQ
jgi:hypothetical protein